MTEQDTLQQLRDHCTFGENRAYILIAITRKNENEEITSRNGIIFREVLKTEKDIRRKYSKICAQVDGYVPDEDIDPTFRLYVSVNARDTEQAYWTFTKTLMDWGEDLHNEEDSVNHRLKRLDQHWKSELQMQSSRADKHFLFDLDYYSRGVMNAFCRNISQHTVVLEKNETPNGWHVITEPFNYNELDVNVEYELKKDDMTFLEYL